MTDVMTYSEREHDLALEQHELRWNEMHALGRVGHDTSEYREARQDVIEARQWLSVVAHRPKAA